MGNHSSKEGDNSSSQNSTTVFVDIFRNEMLEENYVDAIILFIDSKWSINTQLYDRIFTRGGNRVISSCSHSKHINKTPKLGDVFELDSGMLPSKCLLISVSCEKNNPDDSSSEDGEDWTMESLSLIVDNQLKKASELKLSTVVIPFAIGYPNPELEKLIPVLYHKYCLTNPIVKDLYLITVDPELLPLMKQVLLDVHESVNSETHSNLLTESPQASSQPDSSLVVDTFRNREPTSAESTKELQQATGIHQNDQHHSEQILYKRENNTNDSSRGNRSEYNIIRQTRQGDRKNEKETIETQDIKSDVENKTETANENLKSHENEDSCQSEVYQNYIGHPERVDNKNENLDRKTEVLNDTAYDSEAGNNSNSQSLSSSHFLRNFTGQENAEHSLEDCDSEGANYDVLSSLNKGDNCCKKKTEHKFSKTLLETFPDIQVKKSDYERSFSSGSEREDSLDFENVFESDSGYQIKDENREQNQINKDKEKTFLCPICFQEIQEESGVLLQKCKHKFCKTCLDKHFETSLMKTCPVCRTGYGKATGNQPDGLMFYSEINDKSLPGYQGYGIIVIDYEIQDGVQGENHPAPGTPFKGARRTAFLPKCPKGEKVLRLLQKAFDQKLIFTVGTSHTSGRQNVVTWNDIHHKTRIDGGPERYGYPDPEYLDRVLQELKYKGITDDD